MKEFLKQVDKILSYSFEFSDKISISVKAILLLILILIVTSYFLKSFKRIVLKRLEKEDRNKFGTIYSFGSWLIYIVIFLTTLHTSGVNITAVFAASAALLIGVGLALQTFFQDIISGVFIIFDQTAHVGDIIEINGKIGRVEEIRLRTTRMVTIENKVLVIPNHLYLAHSLYNWTQNGENTRESILVGVAYGSDLELVKKLLIQAVLEHPKVERNPGPTVYFTEFGDSSLNFKVVFTSNDSFLVSVTQSDIRFKIDKLFREHNITIPFPQRDVHIRPS